MSRKPIIIKVYFDYDKTLIQKNTDPIEFNGSSKTNDPGIWIKEMGQLEKEFAGKIIFEKYLLTSRRGISEFLVKAARLLNFKPIDKITGKSLEEKTQNISFAIHYPEFAKKIILKNSAEIKETYPYFVWEKNADKLLYYADNLHYADFFPSVEQMLLIKKLAENAPVDKVLDWNTHKELYEAILKCAEESHIVTYSPQGKELSKSKLEEASFRPAFHLTPLLSKAVIMNSHKLESKKYGQVMASILIDDQPSLHLRHLNQFSNLFILGCQNFNGLEYDSPKMLKEVKRIFGNLKYAVSKIYSCYENYQSSLLTLSQCFIIPSGLEMEFSFDNYRCVYKAHEDELKEEKFRNLANSPSALNCYLDILLFLHNYCQLFEKLKPINEEKLKPKSLLDLIPLLKLTNKENWVVNYNFKLFINFPLGSIEINQFLKTKQREFNDFQLLIDKISADLELKSHFYSPKYIVFIAAILKLYQLMTTQSIPNFNLAVNKVMEILNKFFPPLALKYLDDSKIIVNYFT